MKIVFSDLKNIFNVVYLCSLSYHSPRDTSLVIITIFSKSCMLGNLFLKMVMFCNCDGSDCSLNIKLKFRFLKCPTESSCIFCSCVYILS